MAEREQTMAENFGLTYTKVGDYYFPNLALDGDEDETPLGKYGLLRQTFLQEHHHGTYTSMLLTGRLMPHLREIDRCGRPVHISEITIPEPRGCGGLTVEQAQAVQARLVRDNFRLWFSWPSVYRISYWNLVDGIGGEILFSGFYNRDMTKKPAYGALHDLVNHEWRTHVTMKADASGRISFRGFKGSYWLRGTGKDGTPRQVRILVGGNR